MSSTVSSDKNDSEYREIIDPQPVLKSKIQRLAALVKKHRGKVVFFTGAGISTGAGIPDFRSGLGSVTGMPPGKWCQNATNEQWTEAERQENRKRTRKTTSCLQAIPTQSHMALVALQKAGIAKGLISQNCDGLHRRSGFDPQCLAELHGNTNLEYCGWCGHEYLRDFRASTGRRTKGMEYRQTLWPKHKKLKLINPRKGRHYTGRRCQVPGCEGYLFDSTIDFGDYLPEKHIDRGYKLAKEAGLCIVLGSRCSVSPACDMPISVGKSGRDLVVVNLQRTGADDVATFRIGAKIDDVMVPLMKLLKVNIPRFSLQRQVIIENRSGRKQLEEPSLAVYGIDKDGLPVDLLWNVQARFTAQKEFDPKRGQKLIKGRVYLNQDAMSRKSQSILQPGDIGIIQTWPWANSERPGYTDVSFTSGKGRGHCYYVPTGQCSIKDMEWSLVSGKKGADDVIVDAASTHGPKLEHIIPMPSPSKKSLQFKYVNSIVLMFRAHYGEPPLCLPVPEADKTATHALSYDPLNREWVARVKLESSAIVDQNLDPNPATGGAIDNGTSSNGEKIDTKIIA